MTGTTAMLFSLGRIVATPGALKFLDEQCCSAWLLLDRHAHGDWGDELCAEDKLLNDKAIQSGLRILSAYTISNVKIYVITEADRSSTTVLLASEY